VSHWWDSHGKNEIDLIALESLDHHATVVEVKRNPDKYKPNDLADRYQYIKKYLKGYHVELVGLSMEDM